MTRTTETDARVRSRSTNRSDRSALSIEISSEELDRAARLVALRSRREATGLFAGNYVSAFRGNGLEFEESRPYIAGDDVRTIDWNATARAGQPYVKHFRIERNQTLLFGLDRSGSMRFGSQGTAKASTAVHALALVAAAAGRAGDSTGLVAFGERAGEPIPVGCGMSHTWSLIRAAVDAASRSGGSTDLAAGLRTLRIQTRRRSTAIVFSDFRDPRLLSNEATRGPLHDEITGLVESHDVVAGFLIDPRETEVPRVGVVRVEDPENPGLTRILDTGSRRARRRYADACREWRDAVERRLRRGGIEVLALRTDQSPLYAMGRFFAERAGRRGRASA